MRKDYIGTIYTGVSDAFQRGLFPIARCIKAMNHDLGVVEVIKLQKRVDMKHEKITIAESRAEQSRAEQSRAEQSRAEQSQGYWLYGQSA